MSRSCLFSTTFLLACLWNAPLPATETGDAHGFAPQPRLRQPVALVLADDGQRLYVANRHSGSVSIIDTTNRTVVDEIEVGRQLADLASLPDQTLLLAVDQAADELVLLERHAAPTRAPSPQQAELQVVARFKVSPTPVTVTVSADGRQCYVASLWSRRLTVVDLSLPSEPAVLHVVDLPFAPRRQRWLPESNRLVVADAFGGRLAAVDVRAGKLDNVLELNAHNLRGLTLTADRRSLLVPHQMLNSQKVTDHFNVHWGGVMSNVVRTVPVERVLAQQPGPPPAGDLYYLGFRDKAAGDPTELLLTGDGRQVIALAGTSEIAVSDVGVNFFKQVPVGRRPTALALGPDQRQVYVADTFSDSISLVDLESARRCATISLGPRPELSLAEQGEMLFYDARLSSDGWYSCHSCHSEGHSNGLLNDNFSDGTYGTPKRVLTLLGTAHTGPWAWNGQVDSLETQIRTSIELTMQGPEPDDEQIDALAAYLQTLDAPPSLPRLRGDLDEQAVQRGRAVFEKQNCAACHQPPRYTTPDAYDVALPDQAGNRRFNPPSLRGVSQRDRLFHDNRAGSLEEVFQHHEHGLQQRLEPGELTELLEFLRSL